jgi:hypothetical protein
MFLVRAVSSCAVGPACTSAVPDQCFTIADRSGARVSFDPAALRFVPPGDPAAMAGAGEHVQCFRMVLDDDGVTAVGEATSVLRSRVFQDSGGDINLDVRLHEVPAIDAGFSAFGSGLFLEPDPLFAAALPMVTRETDFVYAVTGSGDPESGLSPKIDSCSGTNSLTGGIGGSAYTWMAISEACDRDASLVFTCLVQLYFGLRDVMQVPDRYDYGRSYPACGQGDPASVGHPVKGSAPTGVGNSVVVSPMGDVLEELDGAPGLLFADLDTAVVQEARTKLPVLANRHKF